MERQYREMFDEVRSSSRLREEVTRMTMMERKPARRRLPKKALLAAAVLGAVAAFGGRGTAAFALGGGAGLAAALTAHACLFRAWGAAPDVQGVVCWYLLRLGIVFGAVVLALFVPFIDALGVLVPQLFCLPVLAVRLALEKKKP